MGKEPFHAADVCNESDHQVLINAAIKWTGRVDVYINCAGFSEWRPVNEVDIDFWNMMIDTNLKGTFWGCKSAAGLSEGGCIINVSSLAGKREARITLFIVHLNSGEWDHPGTGQSGTPWNPGERSLSGIYTNGQCYSGLKRS